MDPGIVERQPGRRDVTGDDGVVRGEGDGDGADREDLEAFAQAGREGDQVP
ncbi:MAG: hypothetical protein ACHQO8_09590 [Vicinamibacterales bacterium]